MLYIGTSTHLHLVLVEILAISFASAAAVAQRTTTVSDGYRQRPHPNTFNPLFLYPTSSTFFLRVISCTVVATRKRITQSTYDVIVQIIAELCRTAC
jgi:hypothetical protein